MRPAARQAPRAAISESQLAARLIARGERLARRLGDRPSEYADWPHLTKERLIRAKSDPSTNPFTVALLWLAAGASKGILGDHDLWLAAASFVEGIRTIEAADIPGDPQVAARKAAFRSQKTGAREAYYRLLVHADGMVDRDEAPAYAEVLEEAIAALEAELDAMRLCEGAA